MCTLPALPDRFPPRGFRTFPDFGRQAILDDAVDDPHTALLQAARAHAIRVIMVTSAVSGEGKTSLASQLAASLSRIGKTVLIDGDLRQPGLAQLFELPPGRKGLSELLRGEAELAEVVQQTPTGQLHVIDAGRYSSEASQIPEEGLPRVLELLRDQYAFIVLDSSPVLPAAEAPSLGKYVDGVVLSVLHDVSRLSQVQAAYQRLAMLGIRVLGAVVNSTRAPADGSDLRSGMPFEGSDTRAAADGSDVRSGMSSEGSDTRAAADGSDVRSRISSEGSDTAIYYY
jgi:capsular exopolysaccharide synthesis family protein